MKNLFKVILSGILVVIMLLPFSVKAEDDQMITVDFEEESEWFVPRGDFEVLNRTDTEAYSGTYSLMISERTESWHGPSIRIEDEIDIAKEYYFSIWVKLVDESNAELQLSTQIGEGDSASYQSIATKTVSSNEWVQLEGTYRYENTAGGFVSVYVESASDPTVSFLVDDFKMMASELERDVTIQNNLTAIKDVYEGDFLIGNAVSLSEMEGSRLDLLKHHHNLVTAENTMKPAYAYGDDREFNFDEQRQLVDRVKEEGFLLHGHVLVWHQQSPEWLHTEDGELLSREQALSNMERHIEETILNYGDEVIAWEVVNEGIIDNPRNPHKWRTMLRRSEWFEAIGDDYIELAFLKARSVLDENGWHDVKLYYNDYNDDNQSKATAIYNMVKEINESYAGSNPDELLIDGVGMQGHYNSATQVENVRLSIERFIDLGVEIGVTELDVTSTTPGELSEDEEIEQALFYAELFKVYKEYADHISRVTFWGLNDSTSWRSEYNPLLFDGDLKAKKAYEAVIDPEGFLARYDNDYETENYNAEAVYGTPSLSEEDESWNDAEELNVSRYQMAWQGASGTGRVMWDEENLYVRVEVIDSVLDISSDIPWEQDSVEVFIKTSQDDSSEYSDGDGHYRVNASGEKTIGESTDQVDFESVVSTTDQGYIVRFAIPLTSMVPEAGQEIGFDIQINDAGSGSRESIAVWNDLTGLASEDTSVFGDLVLNGSKANSGEAVERNNERDISINNWVIAGITALVLFFVGLMVKIYK